MVLGMDMPKAQAGGKVKIKRGQQGEVIEPLFSGLASNIPFNEPNLHKRQDEER